MIESMTDSYNPYAIRVSSKHYLARTLYFGIYGICQGTGTILLYLQFIFVYASSEGSGESEQRRLARAFVARLSGNQNVDSCMLIRTFYVSFHIHVS